MIIRLKITPNLIKQMPNRADFIFTSVWNNTRLKMHKKYKHKNRKNINTTKLKKKIKIKNDSVFNKFTLI